MMKCEQFFNFPKILSIIWKVKKFKVDSVQRQLECCGVEGSHEWLSLYSGTFEHYKVLLMLIVVLLHNFILTIHVKFHFCVKYIIFFFIAILGYSLLKCKFQMTKHDLWWSDSWIPRRFTPSCCSETNFLCSIYLERSLLYFI